MIRTFAALTVILCVASAARAQWSPPVPPGCPETPADAGEARTVAGDLFRSAAEADAAGEQRRSVALYACCYRVVPHPNTLFNLAVAAEKVGDPRTAAHALERYLDEAPAALNRAEAEALLATVRGQIAALPPEEPPEPPPMVSVVGENGGEDGGRDGGQDGGEQGSDVVAGGGGEPVGPVESAGTSTLEITGWVLLGAGALVAGAGGAAFGVLAADEKDTVENPATGTSWVDAEVHVDSFETYQAVEIAMFALGGAALVTGAVLLLLEAGDESAAPAAVVVAPTVTPDGVGLGLTGRF